MFATCEKCGGKLIERKPSGLWCFKFGRMASDDDGPNHYMTPVEMHIHGSIKMKCIKRSCRRKYPDHWNVLNFFPNQQPKEESIGVPEDSGIKN